MNRTISHILFWSAFVSSDFLPQLLFYINRIGSIGKQNRILWHISCGVAKIIIYIIPDFRMVQFVVSDAILLPLIKIPN